MENRGHKIFSVEDLVNKMKKLRQKYKVENDKRQKQRRQSMAVESMRANNFKHLEVQPR